MTIVPQPDHSLNGKNIIGFEAYMFMTKDKFITQHRCILLSPFLKGKDKWTFLWTNSMQGKRLLNSSMTI